MIELDYRELIERFDEVLDEVERGETFSMLRDGRRVAILERHLDPAATANPA